MTAVVAALAAALFGTSDFLGGFASKRAPVAVVTLFAQAVGLAVLLVVAIVWQAPFLTAAALAWGALAGVAGTVGVVALYAGLATGRMSVVAPVTASLTASLPAIFDFARGTRPGPTALAGIALALVAVVIVSVTAEEDADLPLASARRAIGLAAVAGVAFACSLVSYSMTTWASGFAPLVAARVVTIVLLLVWLLSRTPSAALPSDAFRATIAAGAVDASANVLQVAAIRLGPLAVATVIGGLYPVATILLARFVLHERLHVRQAFGVALALVAVVLAAWP